MTRRSWAFLLPAVLLAVGGGGLAILDEATSEARKAQEREYVRAQLAHAAGGVGGGEWAEYAGSAPGIERVYIVGGGVGGAGDGGLCVLEVKSPPAYNGALRFLLGVDAGDGEAAVRGVRLVRHAETPGIGARIEDEAWLSGLVGMRASASDTAWRTVNGGGEYDGLTGATISGDVLLGAVRDALASVRGGCESIMVGGATNRGVK